MIIFSIIFFSSTTLTSVLTSSNPQQQQPLTVTPASGGFPNLNGTSLYRQSFGQSNGNATFPPTAALLQNQSPTLQNGIFLIFLVSMEPFFSYPLLDYFEVRPAWLADICAAKTYSNKPAKGYERIIRRYDIG